MINFHYDYWEYRIERWENFNSSSSKPSSCPPSYNVLPGKISKTPCQTLPRKTFNPIEIVSAKLDCRNTNFGCPKRANRKTTLCIWNNFCKISWFNAKKQISWPSLSWANHGSPSRSISIKKLLKITGFILLPARRRMAMFQGEKAAKTTNKDKIARLMAKKH